MNNRVGRKGKRPWWVMSNSPTLSLLLGLGYLAGALLMSLGMGTSQGSARVMFIVFEIVIGGNAVLHLATSAYLRRTRRSGVRTPDADAHS